MDRLGRPSTLGGYTLSFNYLITFVVYSGPMYKWHHLVENFFCKLKHFRRLAMRFEKTDASYAAMIHVVSSRLALA